MPPLPLLPSRSNNSRLSALMTVRSLAGLARIHEIPEPPSQESCLTSLRCVLLSHAQAARECCQGCPPRSSEDDIRQLLHIRSLRLCATAPIACAGRLPITG